MDLADDELMVRYLEGVASDEEVALLETRLAGDRQSRREFVRLAHLQALFIDLPRISAAPMRRLRWRWSVAMMGSAAALVLIGILWYRPQSGADGPSITSLSGTVRCLRAGIEVGAHVGDRLDAGDHLSVEAESLVTFSWRDRITVRLAELSEATLGGPMDATITLAKGDVHAVTSHIAGLTFRIATPEGQATDIGTEFTVHRDDLGTRVRVDRGQILLSNTSGQLTISAGGSARIAPGSPPQPDSTGRLGRAGGPVAPGQSTVHGDALSLTASGVVTQVDPKRKSFTLIDSSTRVPSEYRAYFAGGHPEAILVRIAALKIGDSLNVTYLEREGRRALAIIPLAGAMGK